jgi:tetratricopeptide (TPR) repeat protein
MTQDPRLFVSFSSRDQDAVRMLFSALAVQRLKAWDYSREGERLHPGQPVEASLAERVSGCDYFLAVVSASSTDADLGRYTAFEVRCAQEAGLSRSGRLLPVLLTTSPPAAWPGAYAGLEELLHVELDPSDQGRFDDAVRRICDYLSVPYVPPILNDPRVFFSRRFQQEMSSRKAGTAEYVGLMEIMIGCAEKVARHEWEEAEKLVSLFLTLSAFKMPGARFYYPQIIKGVCELQSGRFEAAAQTFAAAAGHPLRDENSYGGLGHAYFYQRRYDEALAAFEKALELGPTDKTIEFNIVGALLHAGSRGGSVPLPEAADGAGLAPEDLVKIMKMRGIAHLRRGECRRAVAVFEALSRRAPLDAAAAIYYASALEACGREGDALALLLREAGRLDDPNLYHHLADAYLRAGMIREASGVYEGRLCNPATGSRQYYVEYARILKALGGPANETRMRKICELVLDPQAFGAAPPSAQDFYYAGFANYLLGNHDLARYDYERSGRLFQYYSHFD